MVEASVNATQSQENPESVVHFYERSSGFRMLREVKNTSICHNNTHLGNPLHYPMTVCQNTNFPTDLLVANTNFTVRIVNMETGQMTSLEGEKQHTAPITALHCPQSFATNENLVHVFMTASQDGLVKIWDRRINQSVAQVNSGGGGSPFYSVATSSSMIAAGTNQDLLLWDIHKLQKPIGRFNECHNEDVTAVKFCQDSEATNLMISCSIDNVLNMFDLNNHNAAGGTKLSEEDIIDGAYSTTQPMIDCGFVTPEMLWAVTSINTVEFIRVLDATLFMTISQFPHAVTALISVEVIKGTYAGGQPYRVLVYGGNSLGEVYIYEVMNLGAAFSQEDEEAQMPKAQLRLIDMVLTQEPYSVRQITQVGIETFALCSENNKVQIYRHDPQLKIKNNLQAQAQLLQELEMTE